MAITSNNSPVYASTTEVPLASKSTTSPADDSSANAPTETSKLVRAANRTGEPQAARTHLRRATPARRDAASVRPGVALRGTMPTARTRALQASVRFGNLR